MDVRARVADLARAVLNGERLDRGQLRELASLGRQCTEELLYWAHRVRTQRFGRRVRMCAIVAGKLGGCAEDCKWCAQSSRHETGGGPAARIEDREIVSAARTARSHHAAGFGIVNSGRRPTPGDIESVCRASREILQREDLGLTMCASLGELTDPQAQTLADAGITRYNHNLETSRRLFGSMVTTHTYEDRLRTLTAARRAGMGLCCGGIFGLGENWDDRIDLALTLRNEVQPDVVPLNFLHPIPGTPLAAAQPLTAREILRIIAVFRLAMPQVDLKIAGGREANLGDMQSWAFYAGGTSCIVGNYLTTRGRCAADDLQMFDDLGLHVVADLRERSPGEAEGR